MPTDAAVRQKLPEQALDPSWPEMHELVSVTLNDGRKAILYELQPKQLEAARKTPLLKSKEELERGDYHKHVGYGGAAGAAKSHLARALCVLGCLKWPGINALIIRRTKDEVKKNHVKPFWQEVPKDGFSDGTKLYSWNGSEMCATFRNGSSLYFGYMKEEGDELQYQGNQFDIIVFEEATHYLFEQVRYLTGERMRATQPHSFPFAFYPSNPGNQGMHWYKRLFVDREYDSSMGEREDQYAFVQGHVWDNQVLLMRDPDYIEDNLMTLPEPLRSWRLWGDWDAGEGLALTQLDKSVHLIPEFQVPSHWPMWGGLDWGYAHPWSFGLYTADEDGRCYKVLTLTGRRMLPHEIASAIKERVFRAGYRLDRLGLIRAGHDCWNKTRARGENTPTIAEVFRDHDLSLTKANIDRIHGLNNLRYYLAWRGRGPNGEDVTPYLRFFDNEGNRRCIKQLKSIPTDPDNPEDALKQDADAHGHGGDDIYDETRYAIAWRPREAPTTWTEGYIDAWSSSTLEAEAEAKRRSRTPKGVEENPGDRPLHSEFGEVY